MPILGDSSLDEVLYSDCMKCRHFERTTRIHETNRCAAFPKAIPDSIWRGDRDHLHPYRGDRGIRFEQSRAK